jgi:CheY-like chemotaxis protein
MNEADNFALVPRPPDALEKAEPGAKRILSGMVADTLALAKKESPQKARPLRIVVVVQDEFRLEMFEVLVRHYFKDVTLLLFSNSNEAWQELAQTDPDLLITDHVMSRLSGTEILQRLVDRKATYPIIFMSGWETRDLLIYVEECASRGLNVTMLDYIFTISEFYKELSKHLGPGDNPQHQILKGAT